MTIFPEEVLTMQPTATVGKKSNKAFMILSALGILFVIDSHVGPNFSSLTVVFPYGSFYMPMFAFISGYFFSENHLQSWKHFFQFIARKIRVLLVPYFLWILFYIVVTAIFRFLNILEIGAVSPKDLIYSIATGGTSLAFNDPAWFVPLLFCVIVTYTLIRKLFGSHWNHYLAMVVFALLGAGAVAASQTELRVYRMLMLLKVPCFLQYYHLGVLFRNKLEKWFDKCSLLPVCISAAAINLLLISVYGRNIAFPLYATMEGYALNAPFLPLVTSITGIAFWLKISKGIVPVLGQNKFVNFLSDNTFFFMTHHLAVKHIFLGILIWFHNAGWMDFSGIDQSQFRMYAWYTYSDSFLWSLTCLVFTMALLLPLCALFLKLQDKSLTYFRSICMKKNRDQ